MSYASSFQQQNGARNTSSLITSQMIANASRDPDAWMENEASGGNVKLQREEGNTLRNRYLDSIGYGDNSAEAKDWRGRTLAPREAALQRDLANPIMRDAMKQAGIKDPDSAADLGRALAWLSGEREDSNKPADPAKSEQALDMSQSWRNQSSKAAGATTPGGGSLAGGGGSGGGGFVPGSRSYAQSLAGNSDDRDDLYDTIAQRGQGMTDSFRSIGRQYYNSAWTGADEIGRATWGAVQGLSPDVKLTDYRDPWEPGYGGVSLATRVRNFMDG